MGEAGPIQFFLLRSALRSSAERATLISLRSASISPIGGSWFLPHTAAAWRSSFDGQKLRRTVPTGGLPGPGRFAVTFFGIFSDTAIDEVVGICDTDNC